MGEQVAVPALAYSLTTGVRGGETLEALVVSLVTAGAVSVMWLGIRLMGPSGSPKDDA